MANTNKPFGLAPARTIGGTWGEQATRYYIVSTDPNAYYIGDAVLSAAGGDTLGTPAVIKATSGTETLRGVIVGVEPANQLQASLVGSALNLENLYIPATKAHDYYVYVVDDPMVVFTVQGDATATKQIASSCNKNFSLTVAAGATAQSLSGTVMASASLDVTATLNMKAMGLEQVPGNAFGAYAIWRCMINVHELKSVGTLGV